jgi:hypothetical protein
MKTSNRRTLLPMLLTVLGVACGSAGAPVGAGGAGGSSTSAGGNHAGGGATGGSHAGGSGGGGVIPAACARYHPEVCNPFGLNLDAPALDDTTYWKLVIQTFDGTYFRPAPISLGQGVGCARCTDAA